MFLAHSQEWHDLVNPRYQFNDYVKVHEAHRLRSSSWEPTSQLLRMPLGTSLLPCYASYSCILHEISSSVELQHADGCFANYLFTNYQRDAKEVSKLTSLFGSTAACVRTGFRVHTGFRRAMPEIRSDMYAGASTGYSSPRATLSGLNSRSCPGVHVWLYTSWTGAVNIMATKYQQGMHTFNQWCGKGGSSNPPNYTSTDMPHRRYRWSGEILLRPEKSVKIFLPEDVRIQV